MKGVMEIGASWASLECTDIRKMDHRMDYGDGLFELHPETQYTLKCQCGNSIQVWEREWKGKRANKDCGCGIHYDDVVKTTMASYVSYKLLMAARKSAKAENVSLNEWINRAMKERLERRGELP